MGLLRKAFNVVVLLAEDAVDRLGDPRLGQNLIEARNRASELALENARLEADNEHLLTKLNSLRDEFQFNGPTLYSDEVKAIKQAEGLLRMSSYKGTHEAAFVLSALLQRSDHMDITQEELMKLAHDAVNGKGTPWGPIDGIVPADFWEESDAE